MAGSKKKMIKIKLPKTKMTSSGTAGKGKVAAKSATKPSTGKGTARKLKKVSKKVDKKVKKKIKDKAKAAEKAKKQRELEAARRRWKGLQPKVKRLNENLARFQDPDNANLAEWSFGYKAMEYNATSGSRMKYYDRDTSAGTFKLNVTSFKDFKNMTTEEQIEYRLMIQNASEYKSLTLKGAASRQQKAFETFKKNREKKVSYIDEEGKAHYKRRPKLTMKNPLDKGGSMGGFDTFFKVYNAYSAKDKDSYGSAMIDFIRNNVDIEALSEEEIEKLLDYSYNESLVQATAGTGKEEIHVGAPAYIEGEFGYEMAQKWL